MMFSREEIQVRYRQGSQLKWKEAPIPIGNCATQTVDEMRFEEFSSINTQWFRV
jgi:hypothetical protein